MDDKLVLASHEIEVVKVDEQDSSNEQEGQDNTQKIYGAEAFMTDKRDIGDAQDHREDKEEREGD